MSYSIQQAIELTRAIAKQKFPSFQAVLFKKNEWRKDWLVLSSRLFSGSALGFVFYEYSSNNAEYKEFGFIEAKDVPKPSKKELLWIPRDRILKQPPAMIRTSKQVHPSWKWSPEPASAELELGRDVEPALNARLGLYKFLKENPAPFTKQPPDLLLLETEEAVKQDRYSFSFSLFALKNEKFQQSLPSVIDQHKQLWEYCEKAIFAQRIRTCLKDDMLPIVAAMLKCIIPNPGSCGIYKLENGNVRVNLDNEPAPTPEDKNITEKLKETEQKSNENCYWIEMPFEYFTRKDFYRSKQLFMHQGQAYVPLNPAVAISIFSLWLPWLYNTKYAQPIEIPEKPHTPASLQVARATPSYWQERMKQRKTRPSVDKRIVQLQNGWHTALTGLLDQEMQDSKLEKVQDIENVVPLPPCIRNMMHSAYPDDGIRHRLASFFVAVGVDPTPLVKIWSPAIVKKHGRDQGAKELKGIAKSTAHAMKHDRDYSCRRFHEDRYCAYGDMSLFDAKTKCSACLPKVATRPSERALAEKKLRGVIVMDHSK